MTFKDELKMLNGDISFDEVTRHVYSVDASIYEVLPQAVAIPKTKDALREAVRIASKNKIPITARGAATGTTGGCLGSGLIIDTSKYLNKILEINFEEEFAVCEPGVIQDDLNRALAKKGYRLGPNTSTGNRATIGGMVGNNAAGSHSLLYGQMDRHLIEADVVLADGEVMTFKTIPLEDWKDHESDIYKKLWKIREKYKEAIERDFPKIKRRSSGYNLDALVQSQTLELCRLLAGSEGSLGVAARVKLKIVPEFQKKIVLILHFSNLLESMRAVPDILSLSPAAIELIDRDIIERGKASRAMKNRLSWLEGNPEAVLVVEFSDRKNAETLKKKHGAKELSEKLALDVWAIRKAGLELLLSKRSFQRAIAFIEDLTIPPENLAPFMEEFLAALKKTGRTAGIYGHVGESCLHIRPYINLMKEADLELMKEMAEEVSSLVLKYQGVMSGEHGDGLARSWLNKKMFGESLYQAFVEVKSAFDPDRLMNPGKVVESPSFLSNLRANAKTVLTKFETKLDFSQEGGFELAVDMCNGNGLCRKKEGLMCPSFQATGDEYDTTRARAQVLRAIIHGRLKPASLSHPGVQKVLDLCLECKGCKRECPSEVDMAKMKSEILHSSPKSLRSYLFAHIGNLNLVGSYFPMLTNFLGRLMPKSFLGISPKRPLPLLAGKRFSAWFRDYKQPEGLEPLVLFNDTFTEFNHPEIGKAAVKVLNAMGYKVQVPKWSCCGRPLISKGFLDKAKAQAELTIGTLLPFAEKGMPILFLEPSCLSVFLDEFLPLRGRYFSFESFLAEKIDRLPLKEGAKTIKVHGHCHQKALEGTEALLKVLSAIPGADVSEIPSGCCGMAGSFGYEKEHYELSMKIGDLILFGAIENAEDALITANGTSCRAQILHGTKLKAHHVAEIIEKCLS